MLGRAAPWPRLPAPLSPTCQRSAHRAATSHATSGRAARHHTAAAPEDVAPPLSAAKGAQGDGKRRQNNGMGGEGDGGGKGQKRKKKEVFIYGNYRNYYGYRIDRNVGEDPRLEIVLCAENINSVWRT